MAASGSQAEKSSNAIEQTSVFFTKQPILDVQRRIWGYELLGVELGGGISEVFSRQQTAATLSSTACLGLQEAMERGKKVAVAFDARSIIEGVPHVLPPGHGVVRTLSDGTGIDPAVLNALQILRGAGYLVSVDLAPEALSDEIYGAVDILAQTFASAKTNGLVQKAEQTKTRLLVRGVQTLEQFEKARQMGFHLFQGSFFKQAQPMPGRKLSSNQVSRIKLFQLIETEDPDFKSLAAAISSDVAISFRLLAYLNSPFFGLMRKIQSIDQAITLLGWNKLKVWLRAVLLADMAGQDEIPRELATMSLQRGRFFELLATEYDWWGFHPNTLFLVGIFSLLDVILGMDMADLADKLPLDPKLKAALRRDTNSEYLPLFRLLTNLEDGDWDGLENQSSQLGLELELLKRFHAESRDWSEAFFSLQSKI